MVLSLSEEVLRLAFLKPITGDITVQELSWARRLEKGRRLGPRPKMVSDVLPGGDVIAVEAVKKRIRVRHCCMTVLTAANP